MLKKYFEDLFKTAKRGDAREESYYPDLKNLLISFAQSQKKNFSITVLPKKTEAGNPDFRIWDGKGKIVGYIEAKDLKTENLDSVEESEQLKRYLTTFPNVILTNFFEFRLYRNGQLIEKVQIGRPFIIHQLQTTPPVENEEKFLQVINKFFSFSISKTTTAKSLAIELAKRTRFLRDNVIAEELKEEGIKGTQTLEGFYKAFKEHLIPLLNLQDFSNLFAQTITYGLFAARTRAENNFNRELAYKFIPATIGILRDVFRFISSTDLPQSMSWIIDDIAEVLQVSQVKEIMENFYKEGKGKDPVIHFYETFLAEYDPKEREKRGVYYTPEPVVGYIVRSIHKLLKKKFGKEDGFATQSVTVLDPASGTLTFPAEAIRLAIEETKNKYGEGSISSLIKDHILKDFYAFELMMAPYAIGHLKIGFVLDEYGYKLKGGERFNLFLTNTLDFTKEDPNKFIFIEQTLAKESQEALKVKEKVPIMVVMGNPPYSVSSSNVIEQDSDFKKLYESYKEKVRKEERNIQPLSDDYIKFLAFAHWKIKQAGQGIVGMITNNSYLDGLIHRDMRKKLLDDFSEIFILNLHGSSKKQEKTPEGGKDENVFDIQQGVAIILLVKNKDINKWINYADVWGLREEKYKFLDNYDFENTEWLNLKPTDPQNFFVVKDFEEGDKYKKFTSVSDIFIKFNAGIATGKDDALIDFERQPLLRKLSINDKLAFEVFMKNNKVDGELIKKWFDELNKINIGEQIKEYSYRPFDNRYIIYNSKILQRARGIIMDNFLTKPNIGFIFRKNITGSWRHAFVTESLMDGNYLEARTYVFPLYLYNKQEDQRTIFDGQEKLDIEGAQHTLRVDKGKAPNINWNNLPTFCSTLQPFTSILTKSFIQPTEAIFYYIYAILYSNTYRQKYQEFLKIDFPRIPFIQDYRLFQALVQRGEQLVNLYLLKSKELENPLIKLYGRGDNSVEKRDWRSNQVWINNNQYFAPVEEEVWKYYIGGYQVADQWLKYRKGRTLSSEDIKRCCKVVTAIFKTIEIQKEIDRLYLSVEKSLNS